MNIFEDIIAWATKLPVWQQDAIVRILSKGELEDEDIETLAEYAIKEATDKVAFSAALGDPLAGFKYDAPEDESEPISLKSISDTCNINAIKDGSELAFAKDGITVVYGNNGAGKSGYSRILKASCTCRDSEHVHKHMGIESDDEPSAKVNYYKGDEEYSLEWDTDTPLDASLSAINVFDSRSAKVYLNEENDIFYVPAGLDIFDKLAAAMHDVKQMLESKKNTLEVGVVDLGPLFDDFEGTEAFIFVTNLTHKTQQTDIDRISKLTQAEATEVTELDASLRKRLANDPNKRKEQLVLKWQRFARLHNTLIAYKKMMSQERVDALIELRQKSLVAQTVASEARKEQFKDESYLKGTGNGFWKQLWGAAQSYSEGSVYHEHKFPFTGETAKCVLCQQPLSEKASSDLQDFAKFMGDKSQELAVKAKREYDEALQSYENEVPSQLSEAQIDEIFQELEADEYSDKEDLLALHSQLKEQTALIINDLKSDKKELSITLQDVEYETHTKYQALLSSIEKEGKDFNLKDFNEQIAKDKERLKTLKSKQHLAKYEKNILTEIGKLQQIELLAKSIKSTHSGTVSQTGGEMKDKHLVGSLKDSFNEEIENIYSDGLMVDLKKARTRYGVTSSQIVLTTVYGEDVPNPEEIMSESEQKVISLAGFFAELSLAPTKSAIVLDDPVTSLDHLNIEKIANRIIKEAQVRQVIVFTHNVVFVSHLQRVAKDMSVSFSPVRISKMEHAGVVSEGLPWDIQSVDRRIKSLRNDLVQITKAHKINDVESFEKEGKLFYQKLRETWERAVEEILFNEVVQRYDRGVHTQRLNKVKVSDDDHATVFDNMKLCSSYVHDDPNEDFLDLPKPDDIDKDFQKLVTWVQEVKART